MKFIADLHIHSHYSGAASCDLVPEQFEFWAQKKGITLVMSGVLIGSGTIPVTAKVMEEIIGTSTQKTFLEPNLKAFRSGQEVAQKLT